MEDKAKEFFTNIFSDYIVLDNGLKALIEFSKQLKGTQKENLNAVYALKDIAKEKITSGIIDSTAAKIIIEEGSKKLNLNVEKKDINKVDKILSFDEICTDNRYTYNDEIIKSHYVYNNCIIYVDSINDYSKENKQIFSNAVDKPNMFLTQYNLLKYFLLESEDYKSIFQNKDKGITITPIGSLGGMDDEEVTIFGTLIINEEKKYQIQDNTNIISIDLSNMKTWGKGYYVSGCSVLCQGLIKNDIFKAFVIMHPPPVFNFKTYEEKFEKDFFGAVTKAFKMGTKDEKGQYTFEKTFNVPIDPKKGVKKETNYLLSFVSKGFQEHKLIYPLKIDGIINYNEDLQKMEKSNYDQTIVKNIFNRTQDILKDEFFLVLSNVDVTDKKVLDAIEKIVCGYTQPEDMSVIPKMPFMMIFIGNFIKEQSLNEFNKIEEGFDNLQKILSKNQILLQSCRIVFIPGNEDISLFNGFPKHPFMPLVIDKFKNHIPNTINATNPARFSLFGKEVVLFREDLHKKLSRNSIPCFNEETIDQKEYYVQTILAQGNLAPTPLSVIPRIWHLGSSMSILPLPDILILADVVDKFKMTVKNDMLVINPGSFNKDYSFAMIFPNKMDCDICSVDMNLMDIDDKK
ncbi:MAG: hypothetical protein MJ252_17705 [archaeon]|nr:hypothetical protein [archaeon]